MEHMAKCTDDACSPSTFNSVEWFAIAHHNYDVDQQKWPTEMITDQRIAKVKLPTDLPAGEFFRTICHGFFGFAI